MRLKAEAVLEFGPDAGQHQNKIVREYRDGYKAISKILDRQPEILDMAHRDLRQLGKATSRRGRKADFTSENLLRAIIVMQREGLDYREASVRIAESETLQNFCRLLKKRTIDFTLLNKAYSVLRPETWEMMNHALALRAVVNGTVSIDHVRTDTTVTECNIHWPTDSSLLWDTYRVIAREMSRGREFDPLSCPWRFHVKKIKNMEFFIARYSNSTSKKRLRQVRQAMKTLIVRVEEVLEKATLFVARAKRSACLELMDVAAVLGDYLPAMRQVATVARRRAFDGEKVPNADKGFCPDADTYEELQEQVDYLGMPRRTRDFGDAMMAVWQQWRAGIEGTISCLKRAFRLARCCFRGFKNFASAIGSAVFCHNLRILAKTSGG